MAALEGEAEILMTGKAQVAGVLEAIPEMVVTVMENRVSIPLQVPGVAEAVVITPHTPRAATVAVLV